MWVPRCRCGGCEATHALLPAFVLTNRLDVAEPDELGHLGVDRVVVEGVRWMNRWQIQPRGLIVCSADDEFVVDGFDGWR